jgi:predicted O-methyltransferase YrrM
LSILTKIKNGLSDPKKSLIYLILGHKRFNEFYTNVHQCYLVKPTTYLESRMTQSTDIHEHLTTLHLLTVEFNLKNILELGTRSGESTVSLVEAAKKINGTVTSIDINSCPETETVIKKLNLENYWSFIKSNDLNVEWNEPIDHLFIDALHTYDQVTNELKKYEPFVTPGGWITFHDIIYCPPVLDAINDYIKNRTDLTFYKYFNCNGLGLLRKSKVKV